MTIIDYLVNPYNFAGTHCRPQIGDIVVLELRLSDTLLSTQGDQIALVNSVEEGVFMGWVRAWDLPAARIRMAGLARGEVFPGKIISITRQYTHGGTLRTEGQVTVSIT